MKTGQLCLVGFIWVVVLSSAPGATLYVDVNSTNPISPYADWSTAATNIQDAIVAATPGDTVLVTNGVYRSTGTLVSDGTTNGVAITNALTLESVNGPTVTLINGANLMRCAYLVEGAALAGFTLTNGNATYGGGVECASASGMVSNCVIIANHAQFSGGGVNQGNYFNCEIASNTAFLFGGGASASTLNNCTLAGNQESGSNYGGGGGAYNCTLNNCLLIGNNAAMAEAIDYNGGGGALSSTLDNSTLIGNSTASDGGGANNSILNNCTVISNSASWWGGGADSSTLINCTLIGNSANNSGGGVRFGTLNNCVLVGNKAPNKMGGGAYKATLTNCELLANSAYNGGGVAGGSLEGCIVISNSAINVGGGGYASSLTNCTLVGNSGFRGGGTYGCTLDNCVIYYNDASTSSNYDSSDALNSCCTMPLPISGTEVITNAPFFVNQTGGDFHLQSNSPCINAGNNVYVTITSDLDGNPRIVGGTVDIGAYECQTPVSMISYAWLQQYDLPINTNSDSSDADGDGLNNWQEWIAGTNPTNALSVLKMTAASSTNNPPGLVVTWQSVSNITYFLQSSTNLAAQPAFSTIRSNLVGQAGATSYPDTNAVGPGPYFYRVGVQ